MMLKVSVKITILSLGALLMLASCGAAIVSEERNGDGYRQITFAKDKLVETSEKSIAPSVLSSSSVTCETLLSDVAAALENIDTPSDTDTFMPHMELRLVYGRAHAAFKQGKCNTASGWATSFENLSQQAITILATKQQ